MKVFDLKTRKYIDPSLPGFAYHLAHGLHGHPDRLITPEQRRHRAHDRFYREAMAFCSRWAVAHG